MSKYGLSPPTGAFRIRLFLAVPGPQLLPVVHVGAKRQGPYRVHTPVP